MPAAYYDISIEEGSSFRLKLKFKDSLGKTVVLKPYTVTSTTTVNGTPITTTNSYPILPPEGFEDMFRTGVDTSGNPIYDVNVFARLQVRNSVNAGLVELTPVSATDSGSVTLFGESWRPVGSTPIELSLSSGESSTANIKIVLSSFNTRRINYGNYLYDMELVYHKSGASYSTISEGLDKDIVVFRILQGRFIVTPSISR